jgi:hypothetical protein
LANYEFEPVVGNLGTVPAFAWRNEENHLELQDAFEPDTFIKQI